MQDEPQHATPPRPATRSISSLPRVSLHPNKQIVVVCCARGHLLTCCLREQWEDSLTYLKIRQGRKIRCEECNPMRHLSA